jgi:UDP-glucose 4-epimerase
VRDLTYVLDTVEAFLAAGSTPGIEYGRPYNAGSQQGIAVADLIDLVRELSGCAKPVIRDESRMRPVNSEVRTLLADSRRLRAATGWRPEIGLRQGLVETIEWWRDRLAAGRVRRQKDYMT